MKKLFLLFTIAISIASFGQVPSVSLTPWVTGVTKPVDLTNIGDNRIFIVLKDGQIVMYDTAGTSLGTYLDINSIVGSSGNEQGLLGLAFDPHYNSNGYFFVDYTDNNGNTVIERFKVDASNPNHASASSGVVLLNITQPYTNHNGGCLRFGADGYLYIGMGDGGSGGDPGNRAQDTTELLGKMLRLDVHNSATTYVCPPSNPFFGNTPGRDEIFTYGMRNPWRFNFDDITDSLWIADVGQNTYEEVDVVPFGTGAGENFGWRCYEATHPYTITGCGTVSSNYHWPIWEYIHSGSNGCSITGGLVYRCPNSTDMWGRYLYSDYCSGMLWSLKPAAGTFFNNDTLGDFNNNTMAAFGTDKWGNVYICGEGDATVYKLITPSTCAPTAAIHNVVNDTVHLCNGDYVRAYAYPGFTYDWISLATGNMNRHNDTLMNVIDGLYSLHITSGSCDAYSDTVFVLNDVSNLSLTNLAASYISGDPVVTLNGFPFGGYYTGSGMTGNQFDPSVPSLGNDTITYYFTNQWGCSYNTNAVTNILPNGILSINNISGVSVNPNPTAGMFKVSFFIKQPETISFSLYDVTGRLISTDEKYFSHGKQEISFDKNISDGIYQLKLEAADVHVIEKIVISK